MKGWYFGKRTQDAAYPDGKGLPPMLIPSPQRQEQHKRATQNRKDRWLLKRYLEFEKGVK